ncbi:MAG: DNA-directed RNA polymerase subunit A' [Nanoarchaeota archaeon]
MEVIYKKVGEIQFNVFSPKSIKKIASTKIVTPELYDKEGYPVDGGLMDVRLGVIDPGLRCKTCGEKLKHCIGHFGYIELARPVIHIKFIQHIYSILKSMCWECNKIMMEPEKRELALKEIEKYKESRNAELRRKKSKEIVDSLKNIKKCPYCKQKKMNVKFERPMSFVTGDKKLNAVDIKSKFEKISDEDSILLGFEPEHARPEWSVLTVLPVPPVTMRPSITLETGERSEDDLTHKLGDIVRINQRLFESINAGAPEVIVDDLWDLLQYHITTYFDNTIAQVPPARHRSGQALKTITERIKSKEGRFRYNLAGKRINYAARTVISPDPEIDLFEVGIPKQVAMDLTIPDRVTKWNMKFLKEYIKNGSEKYPGSNYVVYPDGRKKKITDETKEVLLEELEPGFIVERHLINGDIALFNRQPSIHKMSIMAHRIKLIPGKSFRLNPCVCLPYNADFDGDEMNLHIPQTEEARAEAELLMQVQTQIISPKHGMNVIGCIEDSVSGNYLLTRKGEYTKEGAVKLLLSIGVDTDSMRKFGAKVDGKEILSALLPSDFSYFGSTKNGDSIKIYNGKLIEGYLDKSLIGDEGGSIIREIHKKYGDDDTIKIVSKLSKLGIAVLLNRGFTTGISDSDISSDIKSKVKAMVNLTRKEVDDLIEQYNSKKLEQLPSKTLEETLEIRILQLLNSIRSKLGELIAKTTVDTNPTFIMARSGAKGNVLNLAMISVMVGQQALRGRRIANGYQDRTLAIFKRNELTPESKGFIDKGYKDGLTPAEFFFGAMTGRDSLMDTALRTPKSGYLYRRLANALQDLKIEYDHTVRDANNVIVQFKYGEDGIDVAKSERGTINVRNIVRGVLQK